MIMKLYYKGQLVEVRTGEAPILDRNVSISISSLYSTNSEVLSNRMDGLMKNINYDNFMNNILSLPRGGMRLIPTAMIAGNKQPVSLKSDDLSGINNVFKDVYTVCSKTGKDGFYPSLEVKRRGVKHMLNSSFAVIDLETYSNGNGIQIVYCVGVVVYDVLKGEFTHKCW
jgi:hypothetical protein